MKFQPDRSEGVNLVTRQEGGRLWVGASAWARSILVPWQGEVQGWGAASPADLAPAHFEQILALRPELVVFGSGARMRFVPPALYRCLIEARVGVETMDTAAACRTFNVLAGEGRCVVGALLVVPADL
ncbi:MAG: Mth938-like domain-containing protein [Rubrivivax sp.]